MSKNKRSLYILLIFIILLVASIYADNQKKGEVKGDKKEEAQAEVIFLDVGQGDATLIQQGWSQILIDGGDGQDILNRLGEFMPLGDRKVEFVVVTHPDKDHMGGLLKVLENYEVGEILESGIACEKDICEEWESLSASEGSTRLDAKLGQEITMGEDTVLTILHPFTEIAGQEFDNANEASLVLKVLVEDRIYLLTGDIENATEKKLVESNLDLDADVLKISHHGSKSATGVEFLMAVSPDKAVISVGENSYGHPTEEVLTRLRNMNIEIYRTDEVGSIEFKGN